MKVFLLLTTFVLLKCAFQLHLFLKTVDELDLSSEFFLVIMAFAQFFFPQLPVAAFFLLPYLLPLSIKLLLFTLAKEFDVLVLQVLIHAAFFHLSHFALLLLLHLLVELFAD